MTIHTSSTSPRLNARIVGALYLLIFFVGPFAFMLGRVGVVVPGDPTETINNLMASESTFRSGMVAETVIILAEIVLSAMLYVLFARVNRSIALAAVFARLALAVLQAVNLFTAVPALLLLGDAGYITAFQPDQVNALVLLFADINAFVILIWGLLFGFHLLLLGYLVYGSRFLPRVLGVMLIVAGIGYLTQSYGHIVAPQYDETLSTMVIVLAIPGELAFTVWLLWKGVNVEQWNARNSNSIQISDHSEPSSGHYADVVRIHQPS